VALVNSTLKRLTPQEDQCAFIHGEDLKSYTVCILPFDEETQFFRRLNVSIFQYLNVVSNPSHRLRVL
jgi:hypothetical protein